MKKIQIGRIFYKYFWMRLFKGYNKQYHFIVRYSDGSTGLQTSYGMCSKKSEIIKALNDYKADKNVAHVYVIIGKRMK